MNNKYIQHILITLIALFGVIFPVLGHAQSNNITCSTGSCTIGSPTFYPTNGVSNQHAYVGSTMTATVNPQPVCVGKQFTVSGYAPSIATCGNGNNTNIIVNIGGKVLSSSPGSNGVCPYVSADICTNYTLEPREVQHCKPAPINRGPAPEPGDGGDGSENCTTTTVYVKQCHASISVPVCNESDVTAQLQSHSNSYVLGIQNNPNTYQVSFTAPSDPGDYSIPIQLDVPGTSYSSVKATLSYSAVQCSNSCISNNDVKSYIVTNFPTVNQNDVVSANSIDTLRAWIVVLYGAAGLTQSHGSINLDTYAPNGGEDISPGATTIKANHFLALRAVVDAIYSECKITPNYNWSSDLAVGQPIQAKHYNEFKSAVVNLINSLSSQ